MADAPSPGVRAVSPCQVGVQAAKVCSDKERSPVPNEDEGRQGGGQEVPLAAWRSVDWRFLLPLEGLSRVGYVGSVPHDERRVLAELGTEITSNPGVEHEVDVLVTDFSSPDSWRVIGSLAVTQEDVWVLGRVSSLRASGWSRIARHSLWRLKQRLVVQGLVVEDVFWHAPNRERCSYIVAIDNRRAVDDMLKRYHGVPHGRLKSFVARLLNAAGCVALIAPDLTVVARPRRTGEDSTDDHGAALSSGLGTWPTTSEGYPSRLLVTPWFEASRHVLCLYIDPRGTLTAVAKMPRRPGDVHGIRHEAEVLRALARTEALAGHLPVVLELSMAAKPYLLETALRGRAADPGTVRALGDGIVEAGLDFIARMPTTSSTTSDTTWFTRLIEGPLSDIATCVALPSMPALVQETLARLEPLRQRSLPLVAEHGDLSHPNLMLDTRGHLLAVDWERSNLRGVPGHDLFFLLQYVAEARHNTFERIGQLAAFDDAFVGPTGWARPWVQRYASNLGLSTEILPALLLATWARSSAGLAKRIAPPEGGIPTKDPSAQSDTLAAAFANDRDHALWIHALARFDELLS